MTNEKNNTNELVSDDDPTSELEVIEVRQGKLSNTAIPQERDEQTSDLEDTNNLETRVDGDAQRVSKLRYDIEQLRSRWMGVDAENKARGEVIMTLTAELHKLRDSLATNDGILASRNEEIESLKSNLRNQEVQFRAIATRQEQEIADMRKAMRFIPEPLETVQMHMDETDGQSRYQRTEAYADSLRRKLQDLMILYDNLKRERARLAMSLQLSSKSEQQLFEKLTTASKDKDTLAKELANITDKHAEEIRLLRFELADAQSTVAQNEELNSQLETELIDTRGFKEELEQMLCDNDTMSRARIDELEQELVKSQQITEDLEEKLEVRGDAINAMLAELARKPERFEPASETEAVISKVDKLIAEQFEEAIDRPVHPNPTNERVARMLLGKAGDKLLRFPLFKDQLTIGRTSDNDIHLHSAYISRRHAVLQIDGDATRVIDWGSRNGVFVNSKRVTEHFLKNGDIVTIGNVNFRYDERTKRDN